MRGRPHPLLIAGLAGLLASAASAQDAPAPEEQTPEKKAAPAPEKKAAPAPEKKAAPAAKADAPAEKEGREPPRLRAPSESGATGLDRVWSADTGPVGSFRLRATLGWFDVSDWPRDGSDNQFTRLDFAFAWTPIEYLETFLAVTSTSNSNDASSPSLLQTQGDLTLGLKGSYFVTDAVGIGAAFGLHLLSGLGEGGFAGDGTSVEFRVLSTFDFHRAKILPLRLLLDVSYYAENSEAVYSALPEEPDIVQEWGLQASRYDRLMIGLGLEAPIEPWVSPYLEYRVGTPFLVELERRGEGSNSFQFASVPHTITPGVRGFPLPELMLEAAVRIGLSDKPYTGVQQTPPWMLVFGLAYTLDPRPQVIEREVEAAPSAATAAAPTGRVSGRVLDEKGAPVPEARVDYPDRPGLSAQLVSESGQFAGYLFPPGKVRVRASAPAFEPATVEVTVEPGKTAPVDFKLKSAGPGQIEVRVFDPRGKAMTALVELEGTEVRGEATAAAPFTAEVKPGRRNLVVSAKGMETFVQKVEIRTGQVASIRVPMKRGSGKARRAPRGLPGISDAPPRRAAPADDGPRGRLAELQGNQIVVKRPVRFEPGTAQLTEEGKRVLNDVAQVMKRDKRPSEVRVETHTDNQGDRAALVKLSTARAQSAKAYLVQRGVAPERLSVAGYGPDKPVAPNMTARGRKKNDRVEFRVLRTSE